MKQYLKDIVQFICVFATAFGLVGLFLKASIYFNAIWSYPLGFGLSLLTILGAFEIVERGIEK